MRKIFQMFIAAVVLLAAVSLQAAVLPGEVRFHDMERDTTRLTELLKEARALRLETPGERVAWFGKQFLGTPYVAHTLECDSIDGREYLTVNLDELDCTTFMETCVALAITLGEERTSWRDYVYNLERLRYRGGEMNGYSSRLHYIAEWVVDNGARGLVKDVTDRFPSVRYHVKTIDFMTSHRDRYPMLADSVSYERIKSIESGYRGHRYPYVKSNDTGQKHNMAVFRSGDVVALTSTVPGLDVTHMGIIIKDEKGVPHLLHASMSEAKVVLGQEPLSEYLKRNRSLTGVRVIRVL